MNVQTLTNEGINLKMPKLLDGRTLRDKGIARLKRMMAQSGQKPTLAIIQIGNLDESRVYIEQKRKFAEKIGAGFVHQKFSDDAAEKVLVKAIDKLNQDRSIHGIVVQLPMPVRLNKQKIIDVIITPKDVDGLTAENKKLFESGDPRAVAPATARGVLSLLRFYKIPVAGKKATVIGRSALVGGPIATLLRREGALVTVCHSQTLNTAALSRAADILIVAAGKPRLVTKDYVSAGQTVIDVGINSLEGDAFHATHAKKLEEEIPKRRLVGDVDFESVKDIVGAISPVPGGVGPMTVVSLFENLVSAYQIQHVSGRQDL